MINSYSNIESITIILIQHFKLPITKSTARESIKNHPDYPSLLSISDSLNKWQIPNAAFKIEANKLSELPLPFIAHLVKANSAFALVTSIGSNSITYQTGTTAKSKQSITIKDFLKIWDGVVLLTEPTAQSAEPNYKKAKQQETIRQLKMPLYTSIGLLLTLILGILTINNTILTFSLIKFLGIIVTTLLLWYEVDNGNPFLQQICTGTSKTNCNAILNSKDAKLFGIISWSEIGFFYFASGWLLLLFSSWLPTPAQTLPIIVWLNLLAMPYTVFSVYYQWRIAKQWCRLCLTVQVLLVAELIVSITTNQFYNLSINQLFNQSTNQLFIFSIILPVAIWYLLKMPLKTSQEAKNVKRQLIRLKFNNNIFNVLLLKQKKIAVIANDLGIVMGNPNGDNTIIKVCNPYCGPCAKGHTKIHNLLEITPNLRVQVLFTATNKEGDIKTPPIKHLLAIAAKGDATLTAQAMEDWYKAPKKDYETFAKKYPINKEELDKQINIIDEMSKWCEETKISFTPTYFINGYQIPDIYDLDDIGYFLN
ncbi:MAG: thioredoxin domain-containing protein [Chitinophagaceae bacterium]|nr:thioredoxin domain-containing protein [Chitinophagaceae bacterium]